MRNNLFIKIILKNYVKALICKIIHKNYIKVLDSLALFLTNSVLSF